MYRVFTCSTSNHCVWRWEKYNILKFISCISNGVIYVQILGKHLLVHIWCYRKYICIYYSFFDIRAFCLSGFVYWKSVAGPISSSSFTFYISCSLHYPLLVFISCFFLISIPPFPGLQRHRFIGIPWTKDGFKIVIFCKNDKELFETIHNCYKIKGKRCRKGWDSFWGVKRFVVF